MALTCCCDACGKAHSTSAIDIGRRKKCDACGHMFTMTPPPIRKPPAMVQPNSGKGASRPVPYAFEKPIDLIPFATTPEAQRPRRATLAISPKTVADRSSLPMRARASNDMNRATASTLTTTVRRLPAWLSRVYPTGGVLLACVAIALCIARMGSAMPLLWTGTMIGFPVLAVVLFSAALSCLIDEAVHTPGHFEIDYKALLAVLGRLALAIAVGIWLSIAYYRWTRNPQKIYKVGPFYSKLAGLIARTAAVAAMPLLMVLASISFGTVPQSPPTAFEKKVAREQFARQHGLSGNGKALPPPQSPAWQFPKFHIRRL